MVVGRAVEVGAAVVVARGVVVGAAVVVARGVEVGAAVVVGRGVVVTAVQKGRLSSPRPHCLGDEKKKMTKSYLLAICRKSVS